MRFPGCSDGKESTCNAGDLGLIPLLGRSLCWEDPLEKGMSTHSSILTWRIPWTEEPGGLYTVLGSCKELHTTERLTLSFFTFTGKRVGFPIFLVPYFIFLATGQMVRWTRLQREGENTWLESPRPDLSPSQLSFLPASWLCPSELTLPLEEVS